MARRNLGSTRRRDEDHDDEREDEEETPRRGRSRRQADEDEAVPPTRTRGRGRSAREDDGEDDAAPRSRSRSRRGDDDEDERPRRERGSSTVVGKGWGAVSKVKTGDYTDRWDVPEKPTLIKFLEPEPFTVYAEHFIEDLPKGQKKSFVCLGDDCPLCDSLGDRPSSYAGFNILDLSDPDSPKVVFLRASIGLAKDIQTFAEDKRSKPIDRVDVYFTLHRKKEKGARYQLAFVKARDVEDDFDFEPFTEDEIEDFLDSGDLITEEQVVFIDTRKRLREVVDMVEED